MNAALERAKRSAGIALPRSLTEKGHVRHVADSPAGDSAHQEIEWFRRILVKHITTIRDYLEPQLLLDEFIKAEFLPEFVIRDIEELSTTTEKNRSIVQKVTTKGEEGYEMLKECLLRSGQYSLYNVLENAEKGQDADQEILRLGVEIEKEARQRKILEKRKAKLVKEIVLDAMEETLTIIIKNEKDFTRDEDISERFDIQGPNARECCDMLKTILEDEEASDRPKRIVDAVKEIKNLIRNEISQADIENNNNVVITVSCSSSHEMRRLLKALRGDDFQEGVGKLTKALGETYNGSIVVQANIEIQKFGQVLNSFRDQRIIDDMDKNVPCDQHPDIPSGFYCSAHDTFCCEECAHGAHTLRKMVENTEVYGPVFF